jgi:glycosyltransferase involved in cell wall biosynthesis
LFAPRYANGWARPGLAGRFTEYAKLQWQLCRAARPGDVVYVRAHFLAFLVSVYGRLRGLRLMQEINGPYEDLFISYPWTQCFQGLLTALQRWQFRTADALVAVTPQLKSWVLAQGVRGRVEVVPNGANVDLFRPGAPTEFTDLPAKFVVFFGGFARWQGLETMLAALDCADWPGDTHLVVIGDGQQRDLVEQAARRNPRLRWLGRLAYAAIPGVVCRSIGGLVPKNRQGDRESTGLFPLKVFESLACGVPAVVTDFPGQADLIRQHDCGLVVPPEDAPALARAVARLAADPALVAAMGSRGAAVVRREHSWQRRAEQTAHIITCLTEH